MRPLQVGRHRHHAGAVNSSPIIFSEGWPFRPVFSRPAGPRPEENSEPVCSIISVRKFRPSQRPSFSEFIVNNYRNASQDIVSAISCFLCFLCLLCPFFLLYFSLEPLHVPLTSFARPSLNLRTVFAHSSRNLRTFFARLPLNLRTFFARLSLNLPTVFAHSSRILSAFSPYGKNN